MKLQLSNVLLLLLIGALVSACGPSQAKINATSTLNAANVFSTQTAMAPTDTPTPLPTETATPIPSATPVPSATPNLTKTSAAEKLLALQATRQSEATATAVAGLATQQAEDAVWNQLVSDGVVTYSKGDLFTVDDFEESWAQRNWYQWWYFDYNMADFVLMTHIDWKIPDQVSWGVGGCGFVARLKDEDNHLLVFLNPRGDVQLAAMSYSGLSYQGYHWQNPDLPNFLVVKASLSGSSNFVLVAEKEFITAYIDGVKYYQWYVALTSQGDIGYTLVSGTNRDYGIQCTFSNTRIWELEKP